MGQERRQRSAYNSSTQKHQSGIPAITAVRVAVVVRGFRLGLVAGKEVLGVSEALRVKAGRLRGQSSSGNPSGQGIGGGQVTDFNPMAKEFKPSEQK